MYFPEPSLTSTLTAPANEPAAGSADWAIQSLGSSKLTLLAASV
ncbi:hypothetical protein [Paenarthrobacter histidinolovorans]|uniref:Uncharacterized protein n=1 Tax=Paenarthrobacter histidinolovorans TaxID=43664 RepID=A0ABW8N5A1_9MICC